MKKCSTCKKSGFTLIELIIVIGIITTLSMMSVGVIYVIIAEDELVTEGQNIQDTILRYANKARVERTPYRIIFDFGRGSLRVYTSGIDRKFGSIDDSDAYADDKLEKEFMLPRGMYFERAVITLDESGEQPPSPDPDEELPDPNFRNVTGAILLHPNRYMELQKIIPGEGTIQEDEEEEEDWEEEDDDEINLDISETKWIASIDADIIVSKYGERKKILIDVRPLVGKIYFKVDLLQPPDDETEEPSPPEQ